MTGHQKAVLWIGLILIVLNLISSVYWKTLKGTLFGASSKTAKGKKETKPTVPIPGFPYIPGLPLVPINTPAKASTGATNA